MLMPCSLANVMPNAFTKVQICFSLCVILVLTYTSQYFNKYNQL